MGATVAVTGVTGYMGKTLLALLERSPAVEHILGIDTIEIPIRTAKLEFHTFDIRDAALGQLLVGADVLVHLAFLVNPMRDTALMADVNVGGFRNVLQAVETAGIGKFVYPSSVYAYGAHADNDIPLTEESPLRPNAGFSYAEHKAETEDILAAWHAQNEDVIVTVTRPAVTLGPQVDNFMSRVFERPRFVTIKGYAPPLQVLHQDDAAAALLHFVENAVPGTFNICADDAVSRAELAAMLDRPEVPVPENVAFPLADVAWKLGLSSTPPAELEYLMYPVVVSNDRARIAGWKPAYSTADSIAATISARLRPPGLGQERTFRDVWRRRARNAAFAAADVAVRALNDLTD